VLRSYLTLHLQLKILPGHFSGTSGSMRPLSVACGYEKRMSIAMDQENPGVGLASGDNSDFEQGGHAIRFDRYHGVHGDRLGLWRSARGIGHDWAMARPPFRTRKAGERASGHGSPSFYCCKCNRLNALHDSKKSHKSNRGIKASNSGERARWCLQSESLNAQAVAIELRRRSCSTNVESLAHLSIVRARDQI
jgi:hypothetical protein